MLRVKTEQISIIIFSSYLLIHPSHLHLLLPQPQPDHEEAVTGQVPHTQEVGHLQSFLPCKVRTEQHGEQHHRVVWPALGPGDGVCQGPGGPHGDRGSEDRVDGAGQGVHGEQPDGREQHQAEHVAGGGEQGP